MACAPSQSPARDAQNGTMSKRRADKSRKPDLRRFVEIAERPSRGVEVSTGRAWVGVDQQVGHGSADALFALTDEQYAIGLANGWELREFMSACWNGQRNDVLMFHPGGGAWRPESWHPLRSRPLPPTITGEIWRHIDALGEASDSDPVELSRALAAGTAPLMIGDDGVQRMTFSLVGEGAYPRPAALIAGLDARSDRDRVREILGAALEPSSNVFALEADRVRLVFVDDRLTEIVLERPAPVPPPAGQIRAFLDVLGTPEFGEEYAAVARLAGAAIERWAVSSGFPRRLVVFDGGVDMQVEGGRVLSARIRLRGDADGGAYRHTETLLSGVAWPPSRDDMHGVLGAPAASSGATDLHRYGTRDLLVEYELGSDGETPRSITAVPVGVSISHGIHRWRSGEFTLFLDALGRPEDDPLVAHVRGLPGVRLGSRRGRISSVEIGGRGYQSERFPAFVKGMRADPARSDIPFGKPHDSGDHDDLRYFEQGCIHVHSADGTAITTITVSSEPPENIDIHRFTPFGGH